MQHRFSFVGSVAFAAALLLEPRASACGGMLAQEESQKAALSAQRVLVAEGEEHTAVVVSVGYEGARGDNAFVLPLQKEPKQIADADPKLFDELENLTAPRIHVFDSTAKHPGSSGCGCGGLEKAAAAPGGGGADDSVRVVLKGQTETYQYVVVGGSSGSSIGEWLTREKFPVPKEVQGTLDGYATRGWVFLAARVRPKAGVGALAPISIHYEKLPPEQIEYPFALSAHSVAEGLRTEVVLYLAGPPAFLPKNYSVKRVASAVRAVSPTTTNYPQLFADATREGAFVLESGMPSLPSAMFAGMAGLSQGARAFFPETITLARLHGQLGKDQLRDMTFRGASAAEIELDPYISVTWDPKAAPAGAGLLIGLSLLRRRGRKPR
ncbi:MAG: DUF2330 domain-containing protein [Polyangiaceae bacterium]